MSEFAIAVEIEDEEFKRVIRNVLKRISHTRPLMNELGQILRTSIVKNFEAQGRPQKWKPTQYTSKASAYKKKGKKVYTIKRKATTGWIRYLRGKKTLIDTANLMGKINEKASSARVEVGTDVTYAAIHHFGGEAGRGHKVKIPARPYFLVQAEDWEDMRRASVRFLEGR